MKILIQSAVAVLTVSAGLTAVAPAAARNRNPLVNAYGEPAGFGNMPDVILPNSKETSLNAAMPGTGGLYVVPGYADPRHFESRGSWQARIEATAPGTVTIGTIEVLDSGPVGLMSQDAMDAARGEVTAQVLGRIKATDKVMASLKRQSKSLDKDTQSRFTAVADEVAQRRHALREDLRTVRAAGDDEWTDARTAVAVSFNAYVQSMHRAEEVVALKPHKSAKVRE